MLGALAIAASVSAQPASPTLADPDRQAVSRPDVARRFFDLAETRRVDIAIIGDSNTRSAIISGHEDGMARALSARFGCYATRVDPMRGQGGWGGQIGGCASIQFPPFNGPYPPAAPAQYEFPNGAFPIGGAYLSPNTSARSDYNAGFVVDSTHPIGIQNTLRYHLTHYLFRTPTDGRINISVREGFPGNAMNNYAVMNGVRTAAAQPRLADVAVDVPPGTRAASGIMCCLANAGDGLGAQGPFYGIWNRLENPNRATGISFSPLLYQGGKSARAACQELLAVGPNAASMREWLRQITRLQNGPPVLLVQIMHGGNDTGDFAPSLGPIGGIRSDFPDGHADNMRCIINTMKAAWAYAGFDANNLYFQLGPYHPREDRLVREREYEDQWSVLANEYPNTFAIHGTMLSTDAEFAANGWFTSELDHAHLSVAGYRAWGEGTLKVLQRAICPADMNDDQTQSVDDILLFVGDWFGQLGQGDFNRDGSFQIEDIFDFLEAWFAGC